MNLNASSIGTRASPIDVEALEDEVQFVSPSQVPPQMRNRRAMRKPLTVVDLDVDANRKRNKRQRVALVIYWLSLEGEEGSNLQKANNVVQTSKETVKVVTPEAPVFTCPVCRNKLEDPSSTICGHIFCAKCIKQAIQVQRKCPTCRKRLRVSNFHRIYLPNSDG